jgi:hypothetical protein
LADGWLFVLICSEKKILLADASLFERKVLPVRRSFDLIRTMPYDFLDNEL